MSAQRTVEVRTTTPAQDDEGWDKAVHEVRVNVGAWGTQTVRIGSHQGVAPKGHIVVGVGQTLTYVHDYSALDSMVTAWADALVMSERMRLTGVLPPEEWLQPAAQSIGVSVRVEGQQKYKIIGIADGASPDGHAHVVLQMERQTFRIYDNAAMWSYTEAWSTALDAGAAIFGLSGAEFRNIAEKRRSLP